MHGVVGLLNLHSLQTNAMAADGEAVPKDFSQSHMLHGCKQFWLHGFVLGISK